MEYLLLSFRFLLSLIFISSSIYKLRNMESHILIINEYRIFPTKWNKLLAWFDSLSELLIGIFLFFGIINYYAGFAGIILLLLYSLGISVNLIIGKTDMSCGCGGIIGNHNISWYLVARNIVLILILSLITNVKTKLFNIDYLIVTGDFNTYFSLETIPILISIGLLVLLYLNANQWLSIEKERV